MRYPSKLLIAPSMMAVALAVAHNAWAAEEAEAAAESAVSAGDGVEDAATSAEVDSEVDEALAKRRRKAAVEAPAQPAEEKTAVFGGPAEVNHKFQTGLSIMPGTGYRLIVPYKEGQFCGDSSGINSKRVCANYVPIFLDFQLSFGVAARADLLLDLRFGLQSDPAIPGSRQFAVAPGVRFWLDQEVTLKFFTTLQFVYDYTNFSNSGGVRSTDVGMRNANGLMYDPIRNVGFFVQFGETVGLMRWFRIDLDVGLGAQIRFP